MRPNQFNQTTNTRPNHKEGFYQSSHYFRSAQPAIEDSVKDDTRNNSSEDNTIDVFEFEPAGFMSQGRW